MYEIKIYYKYGTRKDLDGASILCSTYKAKKKPKHKFGPTHMFMRFVGEDGMYRELHINADQHIVVRETR